MSFDFDAFVQDVREAAKSSNPNKAVRSLLEQCVANPEEIIEATAQDGDDEVCLFEDETLSIWRCKFQPHVVMPPHEHLLDVHIAAYSGGEKNILFQPANEELRHEKTTIVRPGEVLSLTDECIHAVTAEGDEPSLALHVYMGPLMQLKRGLFDWDTGEKIEFTMENFDNLKRPASALPAY